MIDVFWQEVGFGAPDTAHLVRISVRLLGAVFLAALVGLERELRRQPAGLRTHMLVALGAALFTLVPVEAGAGTTELARLVQGLAPGIGFLGAGAILKRDQPRNIHGLTTAASIWLAAAIGFASGAGQLGLALMGTVLTYGILVALRRIEDRLGPSTDEPPPAPLP